MGGLPVDGVAIGMTISEGGTMTNTYIVASDGDRSNQDGSELHPYVGFDGLDAVEAIAKPGDTVLLRGEFTGGVVRWRAHGVKGKPITIAEHPDGGRINGHHDWPAGPAAWTGIDLDGNPTEGVHAPLVRIHGDYVKWSVPVLQSRGRLVQIGGDRARITTGTSIENTLIRSAMTAMIDIRDATACGVYNCDIDTGSAYYPQRGGGRVLSEKNIAGCIKTIRATDITIEGNRIRRHYGNTITPSRGSDGIKVINNEIWDCNGSMVYVHWATNVLVDANVCWYTPGWEMGIHSAYVVNNEEEFHHEDVAAGSVTFRNNIALGTSHGGNIWGNEGKDVMVDGILFEGNAFINCVDHALRTAHNAQYRNFVLKHNLFVAPKKSQLFDLRSSHELDMDETNRTVVGGPVTATRAANAEEVRQFAALLRAGEAGSGEVGRWLAEGKALMPQLQAWWERRPRGRNALG